MIVALGNAAGGAAASLCTQAVIVPVDIIAQRLMLGRGDRLTSTVSSVASDIFQHEGFRGFYRGFLPSVMTYLPSASIWWGTYGLVRHEMVHALQPDDKTMLVAVQAVSSVSASLFAWLIPRSWRLRAFFVLRMSVTLTNPMDVIKTRLQTLRYEGTGPAPTIGAVVKELVNADGVLWVKKGWGARLLNSAPASVRRYRLTVNVLTLYKVLNGLCL